MFDPDLLEQSLHRYPYIPVPSKRRTQLDKLKSAYADIERVFRRIFNTPYKTPVESTSQVDLEKNPHISIDEMVKNFRQVGETHGNIAGRTPWVPFHNYRPPTGKTFAEHYGWRQGLGYKKY